MAALLVPAGIAGAQSPRRQAQGGTSVFGSWRDDTPGKRWHITPDDSAGAGALKPRSATTPRWSRRPANAQLKVPAGFEVKQFASGLAKPRLMRVAPNGDIFVAESDGGRIRVLRPGADQAAVATKEVFATGLNQPFGIAFYPADNPAMGLCRQHQFRRALPLSRPAT